MLLGNYVDDKLSAEVYSVIDNIIESVLRHIVILKHGWKRKNLLVYYIFLL